MRRIKGFFIIGAVAMAGLASAQTLIQLEGAHELTLGNVTFPRSAFGTLIFRRCASCDTVALRVTGATGYSSAEGAEPLVDFLQQIAEIRIGNNDSDEIPVTVFYSLDTGFVTRVALHNDEQP